MSADEPPEGEEPNALVGLLGSITPGFVRRSFAIKFGLVLLVMAASIGVIGLVATGAIADQTEENVERDFLSVATQESDIIQEWLQRNRLAMTFVSDNPEWAQEDSDALNRNLDSSLSKLSEDVEGLHLLDRTSDGYVYAGSTEDDFDAGTAAAQRNHGWIDGMADELEGISANEILIKDTYSSGSNRLVGYVSPTAARQGRILLMEVSALDLQDRLQGSLQTEAGTEGGFTVVVNESQTVIADGRTQNDGLLAPYSSDSTARSLYDQAASLRGDGTTRAGVETEMPANDVLDEEHTVGYAPIEQTDWVVLTHAPRSSVFGFVQTIQRYGLFATMAAALLIAVTGAMLGYSTSRSIDRLTRKTEEMREGNLDVTFYTPRVDNIGRLYDGFASMRDALQQQIQEAERSRKEAEVARAEAEEMATYLQQKAEEYSEIMQQCAAGDLTQRMSTDGEEESMDRIADEFNAMIEELEKTTGQLKSYVDEVEQAGAEVEQSANTVREASEQVADSIQRISDGAYDQKERLRQISETMDDVAARLETLASDHPDVNLEEPLSQLREISTTIEETAQLSEETMSESENVAGAAEEQAAELNEVGERAHDLQRYAQPLRDILERFETEAEHEFVFSVGPTGGSATPNIGEDDEDDDADEESEE